MRMHGHAAHDDMKYVPKEQVEEWRKRDPIDRQERRLRDLGVDVDELRTAVRAEIDAAAEDALAGPMPDPAEAVEGVFCRVRPSRWATARRHGAGSVAGSRTRWWHDHDDVSPSDLLRAAR